MLMTVMSMHYEVVRIVARNKDVYRKVRCRMSGDVPSPTAVQWDGCGDFFAQPDHTPP